MKKTINHLFLLDMSGSMAGLRVITEESVNRLMQTTAKASKENDIQTFGSLGYFNYNLTTKYIGKPIGKCSVEDYIPDGGTNIYDSFIAFVDQVKQDQPLESTNSRNVVTIFTDGFDNVGGQDRQKRMADYIAGLDKTKWTITYVTPEANFEHTTKNMGIRDGNAITYKASGEGTRDAFNKIAAGMKRYIEKRVQQYDTDLSSGFFDFRESVLSAKGMKCVVNMPDAIEGEGEHKLPPYAPVEAFVVDEYPACPANWEHGSSKASSYFLGIKENAGMWLDFNDNADNKHDVAVVISIQGVNPITGQKTGELKLQKHENNCPIHNCEFQQDRFCPECAFKWPAQNFISSSSCEKGKFWLDGFRNKDGTVRQYIFTEDETKGVAANLIGNDRVYAIGMAFYRSKKEKPPVVELQPTSFLRGFSPMHTSYYGGSATKGVKMGSKSAGPGGQNVNSLSANVRGITSTMDFGPDSVKTSYVADDSEQIGSADVSLSVPEKTYEVGAGAKIIQSVEEDKNSIDYWESEPCACIFVNYKDANKIKEIVAAGKRKEKQEGFLEAIPVG